MMNHQNGYKVKPQFYVINFDDPRRSHRCNPIHPDFMSDISDAYESAYTIMLNLNKTWVQKQGDFFVESPIILFAAIIWYLRIYKNGKYCTFPHAIELLNRRYEDVFPILTSYPELENYLSPFMDAWQGGAMEQLAGQIASAKIPLSRMISPQLYWVMSASEFTLDINNPEEPKILCIIRKTKCFRILERNAKISKTKRNFSRLYPTPQKFKKIDRLRRNEIHLKVVRTSS